MRTVISAAMGANTSTGGFSDFGLRGIQSPHAMPHTQNFGHPLAVYQGRVVWLPPHPSYDEACRSLELDASVTHLRFRLSPSLRPILTLCQNPVATRPFSSWESAPLPEASKR